MIRLFWCGYGHPHRVNFGDSLSPLIVEMMSGKPVTYARPSLCDMAAIGSVLGKLQRKKIKRLLHGRFHPLHIWGTGALQGDGLGPRRLHIHALRGELTREALQQPASLPLGDPGLLVDRFSTRAAKQFRWGITPHVCDQQEPSITALHHATPGSIVIDLSNPDIHATIRAMQSCDFIASTSLHGLVTADAFGIPSLWMRVSQRVLSGDWKFLDYFSAVGRRETAPHHFPAAEMNLQHWEKQTCLADPLRVDACRVGLEKAFAAINL